MEEIFLDIEGFEGLYQVSNLGNVKSLNYNNTKKEKLLKHIINSNGYKRVNLYKNKTRKIYDVHRLVANAFLPNTHNYPCVNHKDECKTNNVVTNLEWCTYKYNLNYGTRIARVAKSLSNNPNRLKAISKSLTNNPKRSKAVGAYKDGELVMIFPSVGEANRNGFNKGHVADCCNGKRKSYKGYIWSYEPIK